MDSPSTENYNSVHRKKVIEELIRGRESANQLRLIVSNSNPLDPLAAVDASAQNLVAKVLESFIDSISILNSCAADEVSQIPESADVVSRPWDGRKGEDSGHSTKSTWRLKGRRGCQKRRETCHIRTQVIPALMEDGHAWRKYGQKIILNAKHPRSYYRCTHKHDQGCKATKQVQMTEDEIPMYRITYHGHHSCKNLLKPSQTILDSTPGDSNSVLLSFGPTIPLDRSHQPYHPTLFPSIKHLHGEAKPNQSSSSDYLLSPDLTTLESDHRDVISSGLYSCTASTFGHGMDLVEVEDLDDVLQFELV